MVGHWQLPEAARTVYADASSRCHVLRIYKVHSNTLSCHVTCWEISEYQGELKGSTGMLNQTQDGIHIAISTLT